MGYLAEIKPAIPTKWYIVDIRNLKKPKAARKYFESEKQVQAFIDKYYGVGVWGFFPATGTEIIEFGVPFKRWIFRRYWSKYKYLKSYTWQKKKNTRRDERMRQRRAKRGRVIYTWAYPPDIILPEEKSQYRQVQRRKLLYQINRDT